MKFVAITLAALVNVAPSMAQSLIAVASGLLEARNNLDTAVAAITAGSGKVQPSCLLVAKYVQCITTPDDIDDTQFIAHPVVSSDLKLGDLKGTPDYDLGLGLITALRETAEGCGERQPYTMAKYPWLSQKDQKIPIMATSLVTDFDNELELRGAPVSVWNTFADDHATGGVQVLYDYREAKSGRGLEFPDFPMNMPPMEGGFYDIDFGQARITYTLKDNRSATNLIFPEGTFDRYYFMLPAKALNVEIERTDKIVAKVSILEPKTVVETADFFGTGLIFPETLGSSVILVEIVGGTDLTELGQQLILHYTMQDFATYICASSPLEEQPF